MNTKMFGILSVALMFAVALSPLASGVLDATDSSEMDYALPTEDMIATAMQIIEDLPDDYTEDDLVAAMQTYGIEYGALDPISQAYILGVLTGLTIAGIIGIVYIASQENPAGDSSVVAYEQEMLAIKMHTHLDAITRMAVNLLPNDSNMLRYTATYWERAVEFAISNPGMWSVGKTMNAEEILKSAGVRDAINNYIHTWQKAISNEIISVSTEQYVNMSRLSCYQGMSLSFDWVSGSLIQSNPSSSSWLYGDLKTAVYTTNTSSTVFIDVPTESDNSDVDRQFANRIYLYTTNGGNATMTNLSNGITYTLSPGVNKVVSSGLYRLNTSGAIYAGDFTSSSDSYAADLSSCLVFSDGQESFRYALYNNSTGSVKIYGGNVVTTPSKLNYTISYRDVNSNTQSYSVNLIELIEKYQDLIDAQAYIIKECVKDAEATWRIFNACEASSLYVHPSTVMTVLEDSSLSTDALIVNYYNAMKQLSLYYEQYGDDISGMEIEADPNATDVLIFGDIYCNGKLIVDGAIMTPSVYVSSETYTVGESHLVNQQTICTIWKQGAESIEEYSSYSSSVGGIPVATLDAGCIIEVHAIKYKGIQVSEHTLEVPPIVYVPNPIPTPTPVPDPIKYLDADLLITIIMVELAAIIFLLCFIWGNPTVGLIIAAIVIITGILFGGTISSLILGTFEWPWWWPF